MKKLKIAFIIGDAALLLGVVFNAVNQITRKLIFGFYITVPLLVIAIAGVACGIVWCVKIKRQ